MKHDKLYIDWETGDRIAVSVLKDAYQTAMKYKNDKDAHAEDIAYHLKLAPALKQVLEYFGEKV